MGAGKLRVLAGRGIAAVAVAVLAGACGQASSSSPPAAGQAPGPATPTVTPSTVPVLGKLAFGTFPSTWDGTRALTLCEQWSGLRGEYVARGCSTRPARRLTKGRASGTVVSRNECAFHPPAYLP
jgi:hypothetical protein